MIEKMRFVTISGPKKDFDRMVAVYLRKYDIQLENALTEVKNAQDIAPFSEENPYREEIRESRAVLKDYAELLPSGAKAHALGGVEDLACAAEVIRTLSEHLEDWNKRKSALKDEIATLEDSYRKIVPFVGLDYDIRTILHFQNMKYSFGRIPLSYFKKFMEYIYETLPVIVSECSRDQEFVYLVYFTPARFEDRVDAVFAAMYFEKLFVSDVYEGTPEESVNRLHEQIKSCEQQIFEIDMQIAGYLKEHGEEIVSSANGLAAYESVFDVRRYAALTKRGAHTFYILCGWMRTKDARRFREEISKDDQVFTYAEKDVSRLLSEPPTELRHPAFLKPFEMFLEMYGLPAYNELDPTFLLALSYTVFFGFMFGDFGQGAVLCLGGFLLYRLKGVRLAGIISCCGLSSMVFGLLFGSVFGFEDVIEPLWLNPQEAMTNLPFIGNLNTVFVVAVAIGMGMILLCMVLNIINGVRQSDRGKAIFDANGVAGLVFYGALVLCITLFMTGNAVPGALALLILFGVPLLLLFLKEPILSALEKKPKLLESGVGMFVTQGFFEMFEMLLSYFSNTLSFVRIGAFAVSHAAMMGVVMMLAGAEDGGNANLLVVVLGNLFVSGMEGLIVGIQVLRLEYYELFSRFYKGGGRAFHPYGKEKAA